MRESVEINRNQMIERKEKNEKTACTGPGRVHDCLSGVLRQVRRRHDLRLRRRQLRRSYRLPDGAVLEVNHVDEGQPTEFWYAEVEYPTVEAARSWQPAAVGLADYLSDEVTDQPGQSMGAYWEQTRG